MSRKRPKPEPPPRSDEWDDAFLKVSVAVADGSEPDWDEAERIATSPERRSALDELKLIAGIVGRGPDPHYSGRTADPAALTSHLREPLRRPGRAHHEFAPGDRLADRYVIRSLIGRGGFGLVYEAWDEELEIAIAIKVFRLDFGNDSRSLRALKQEALLARAVVHPNICRVYDVGSHRVDEGEVWFLTMELVRGESLLAHLRQRGRLSPGEAWPLVKQMAAGLAKAHEQGIAHLDFKSGNVILQPRGGEFDAILTDFGLARAVDVARATDSLAASAVTLEGTPAYMSPEQVRGEPAGVAADIYAFGVVLYQIVTGALPWTGRTSLDVAQRRLKGDAPRASALVADLDPRWDDAIARCMAREAHARFPGMAELLRALDPTGSEAGPGSDLDAIAVPLPGLPVEPDSLIGREEDERKLRAMLTSGSRLLTLIGTGGIGKTRLALRVARDEAEARGGFVRFVDLSAAYDLESVVGAVATSLSLSPKAGDPLELVAAALANRGALLLVLDNVEQAIVPAREALGCWIEKAPLVQFLVTSRMRTGLSDEVCFEVDPLSPEFALQLFRTRAEWIRPGLVLADAELSAAREAIELVDRIPLAIELAAARMRVMDAGQVVTALKRNARILTGGRAERHETLDVVIQGSWQLLDERGQRALAQCSVFEGGFTLEAAEAVVDLAGEPGGPSVDAVLRSLVDASLLRITRRQALAGGVQPLPRYAMYVSVREFARRELAAMPTEDDGASAIVAAEIRHGRWYAHEASEERLGPLEGVRDLRTLGELFAERDNFLVAFDRAFKRHDIDVCFAALRAAIQILPKQGSNSKLLDVCSRFLSLGPPPAERAVSLRGLAPALGFLGRVDESTAMAREALDLLQRHGTKQQLGRAFATLGTTYYTAARHAEAMDAFKQAESLLREIGDFQYRGGALSNIAGLHRDTGDLPAAVEAYVEALRCFEATGDLASVASVRTQLGDVRRRQGDYEAAAEEFLAFAGMPHVGGGAGTEAMNWMALGLWHKDSARLPESIAAFVRARSLYGDSDPRGAAVSLCYEGMVWRQLGQIDRAIRDVERASELLHSLSSKWFEGVALSNLGILYTEVGRYADAERVLTLGLNLAREVDDIATECACLDHLGALAFRVRDLALARGYFGDAVERLRSRGERQRLPILLCSLAEVVACIGDKRSAGILLAEAEEMLPETHPSVRSEVDAQLLRVRDLIAGR